METSLRVYFVFTPPVKPIVPAWSLSLVLAKLMGKLCEPLATVSLHLLSWKTAFLVAITSAKRASELTASQHNPPFTIFHRNMVVLRPDPAFLPKVTSAFHVNQATVLPTFFPHTQDEL